MAKIIPSRPDPEIPASERKVFEQLAKELPDDWVVIHARRLVLPLKGSSQVKEGEVDFLVLDPKRGYLGLEVKGGAIGRDADGWYSTDRHGQKHKIRDPGIQAQRAVRMVRDYLGDRKFFQKYRIGYGWGVIFPDIEVPDHLDPALPRNRLIDHQDLDYISERIERFFEVFEIDTSANVLGLANAFVSELAPTIYLVPTLASHMEDDNRELVRLTNEQIDLLESLRQQNRVAISGPAGTGKTLLGIEKARQLSREGKRVLFLCFNRPLAEFLGKNNEPFPISTFHHHCDVLSQAAGFPFDVPESPDATTIFWDETAPQLMVDALKKDPSHRFDAIIVDEGQDFKELWWVAIEEMLLDPVKSTFYVFHDPHQAIFGEDLTETLGLNPFSLKYNCRNTAKIAEYSSKLINVEPALKRGTPTGAEVIELLCSSGPEAINELRKLLHHFTIEENISPEKIVILTTHSQQRSLLKQVSKLGNLTLTESEPGPNEIKVSTLHRFKGLESDVVILFDESTNSRIGTNHLYVATSRARTLLAVLKITT